MGRSLNEIETTLVKAARGVGHSLGVAEDLAGAGIWLCRLGLDGVAVVLDCLESRSAADVQIEMGSEIVSLSSVHPVIAAQAAIDFAIAHTGTRVRLTSGLPVPEILLGLAGRTSVQFSIAVTLSFAGADIVEVVSSGISVVPVDLKADASIEIVARALANEEPIFRLSHDRPDIDAAVWEKAEALAALTYVPASDQSRASGAGAGLTDND